MKIKELIKKLEKLNPEDEIAYNYLLAEDVKTEAELLDIELDDNSCNNIIQDIESKISLVIPIDWFEVGHAIDKECDRLKEEYMFDIAEYQYENKKGM